MSDHEPQTSLPGAQASDATISTIIVSSGQILSGNTLTSGFLEEVQAGGHAVATVVQSSGTLMVSAGGFSNQVSVGQGGTFTDYGSAAATSVGSGGGFTVASGGLSYQAEVASGGSMTLLSGGVDDGGTIAGGEIVQAGGTAVMGTILGTETIFGSGSALGETVSGAQIVSGGGFARNTLVFGTETVATGGIASGATLMAGGSQVVSGGGVGIDTVVSAGGTLVVDGGVVSAQGSHGGPAPEILAGGSALVENGGLLLSAAVGGPGAAAAVVVSGGAADLSIVSAGASMLVELGSTSGTQLYGTEILSGSSSQDTEIGSRSVIFSGGAQTVGSNAIDDATVISSGGLEQIDAGGIASASVIMTGGTQIVQGATLSGGPDGLSVSAGLQSGAVLEERGNGASVISATIEDLHFFVGGTVDLQSVAFNAGDTVNFTANGTSGGELTISGPGANASDSISLAGTYTGEFFHLSNDGSGGTDITVNGTPCYCRGTRILTDRGEVAVEDLAIGDRLMTLGGAARPLRWIGRRAYDGRFARGNRDILPVTFRAGCLGGGLPVRDLSVSPLHAMYFDGVLVPAAALVNGSSVVQAEAVADIAYYHLELDSHDVIFAEGAPSETYLEDGNRAMFHNGASFAATYPGVKPAQGAYCAPRLEDGPEVAAIKQRLAGNPVPVLLRGFLDRADRAEIAGWAFDAAAPVRRVTVRLYDNGAALGSVVAAAPRDDLARAGIGDGAHGFVFSVPGGLSPLTAHGITAVAEDGTVLGRIDLPAAPPVRDPAAQARGYVDAAGRDRVLGWAIDEAFPARAVAVQVLVDGVVVASVLANRLRRDVAAAGIGDGRFGFEHVFAPPLDPRVAHTIEARLEATGAVLACTVVPAADTFDAGLEQVVDRAVAGIAGPGQAARVLSFLEAQAAKLRQAQAEQEAGRAGREAALHRRARPALRALVIDSEWPDAARDAGSVAVLSHIAALQALGYAVSFTAAAALAAPPPAELAARGITACAAPFYASVEEVLRRQSGCFDLVYLHRAANAGRYLSLVRDLQPSARVLYAVADLHHVRLARQASVENRPALLAEAKRAKVMECTAAWQADAVLTHSPVEAEILRTLVPEAVVHVVPWAVPVRPAVRGHGVAFVGNFAHAPNVDAALHLVGDIMPAVWAMAPEVPCVLAGAAMPPVVRALAGPRVDVLGQVETLEAVFARAALTVAPLRFGAGIKGKVLESFAAGVPCVMSPVAAEGLEVPAALVAEPEAMAGAIARLLFDRALAASLGAAGQEMVATRFSPAAVEAAFASLLEGLRVRAA